MAELTELQKQLFELQDIKYRDFHSKLMPETAKEKIIGIRIPVLRKFAKVFADTPESEPFLQQLPHQFYEENNLHMMILCGIKDYNECLAGIQKFLPYIDNWATCDLPEPKCFRKHKEELFPVIKEWIASDRTYTVRYGIGMLMRLYLDDGFKEEYLELAAGVRSEEYYVNMMIAWYMATALAKQWDSTIPYITGRKLDVWVHNKTIQKAVESFRISNEQKEILKSLRIKSR